MLGQTKTTLFLAVTFSSMSAFGSIVLSGPQNIVLQGVAGTLQTFQIPLASAAASWNTLQLSIGTIGIGGCTNDIYFGAEVALASTAAGFPLVSRLHYGDPYPLNPVFGSGSSILWGFGRGLRNPWRRPSSVGMGSSQHSKLSCHTAGTSPIQSHSGKQTATILVRD